MLANIEMGGGGVGEILVMAEHGTWSKTCKKLAQHCNGEVELSRRTRCHCAEWHIERDIEVVSTKSTFPFFYPRDGLGFWKF